MFAMILALCFASLSVTVSADQTTAPGQQKKAEKMEKKDQKKDQKKEKKQIHKDSKDAAPAKK